MPKVEPTAKDEGQTAAPLLSLTQLTPEAVAQLVAMVSAQMAPQLAEANTAARLMRQNAKRTYQLEPFTGTRVVTERVRVESGEQEVVVNGVITKRKLYTFVEQKRTVEGGWIVYFPHGHSIFVESEEQLARLGLAGKSGLVDLDSGLSVDEDVEETIKDRVVRGTQRRRSRSGLASIMED